MPAFMSDMTVRERIIVLLSIEGSEKPQMVIFGDYTLVARYIF